MDVLKDSSSRQYSYLSRYTSIPYYYNTLDDKYIYGLTKNLDKDTPYAIHKVVYSDTLDGLSYKYYGRPDYYWIIADFNGIQDPFTISAKFKELKIPSLNAIAFE